MFTASYPELGQDSHFFPYGDEAGDSRIYPTDDGSSGELPVSGTIWFMGSGYTSLWVSYRLSTGGGGGVGGKGMAGAQEGEAKWEMVV